MQQLSIQHSLIARFVRSLIDVIFLGKRTAIPLPAVMHTLSSYLTTFLTILFPRGVTYIDVRIPSFSLALLATILPPLLWNILGPLQYYTRAISRLLRLCGVSQQYAPLVGTYMCGLAIATLSVVRSALFTEMMRDQASVTAWEESAAWNAAAGAVFVVGLVFFIGAYWQLGIAGTYLGDYFGIFREERITAFPFNVLDNPMYDGSSIFHFGEAMLYVWLFFPFFRFALGCCTDACLSVCLCAEQNKTGIINRPAWPWPSGYLCATASAAFSKSKSSLDLSQHWTPFSLF